jgi:TrmH RNA methyltransferase
MIAAMPRPVPPKKSSFSAVSRSPRSVSTPKPVADETLRVAGLPAVEALFARRPQDVLRLFYETRMKARVGEFCKILAADRRPYRLVDDQELAKVAGTQLHGGIVAVARPRPVVPFTPALAAAWAKAGIPLLLLDGVGNPHNLGAIVRTMAFFGLEHLLISGHPGQAGPSEAAHRVAEGGLDWVTLYRAEPFAAALGELHGAGYRVAGTALEHAKPLATLPHDRPLAIVLGNEEDGLPATTLRACDTIVKLPGSGRVQSLNVAATAAILTWELTRPSGSPA